MFASSLLSNHAKCYSAYSEKALSQGSRLGSIQGDSTYSDRQGNDIFGAKTTVTQVKWKEIKLIANFRSLMVIFDKKIILLIYFLNV